MRICSQPHQLIRNTRYFDAHPLFKHFKHMRPDAENGKEIIIFEMLSISFIFYYF